MKYNGCPFCGSYNVDVTDNGFVEWQNNDNGEMFENMLCLDCHRQFSTLATIKVTHRKLDLRLACPYCCEENDVEIDHEDTACNFIWYTCHHCNRLFGVYDEEYYQKLREVNEE